ncbi:MAG: hypothetical protein LBM70_00460, partial [Victivallales bacterium]|nr:hypothetical protein [Victivallales bacterium]
MKRKTTATPSVCHRTHPLLHVGAIALLALLGVVSARVFFDVSAVDIVHFSVLSEESPQSQLPLLCGVIFFELLLLKLHPRTILEVFAPFLLTIPFLWGEPNVNLLIAYIAGVGLSTYRAALIGAFDGATAQKYLRHLPTYGLLLGLLLIALGIFTSTYAYNRMYFSMLDWGVYAQTAWNTFGGEFMRGTYPLPNFSEGHFMPGYFGVMA